MDIMRRDSWEAFLYFDYVLSTKALRGHFQVTIHLKFQIIISYELDFTFCGHREVSSEYSLECGPPELKIHTTLR